ncbi:MAG: Rrf2 family transcriptional regulator [Pseudomonadota bacterium]|nr:Rrf2 family transcriptional regulator [Pseudomonadota bacterium]
MRLSEYTDYACRVLMHCTANLDRLTTIGELAELYGISRNHLMKIVQDLGRHGLLETTRGRGGGIRLGVDPSQVRLGDIVRMAETDLRLVECFDPHTNRCRLTPGCRLQQTLHRALRAFFTELDAVTLADLVNSGAGFGGASRDTPMTAPLPAKRARAAALVFSDPRVGSLKTRKPQPKTA